MSIGQICEAINFFGRTPIFNLPIILSVLLFTTVPLVSSKVLAGLSPEVIRSIFPNGYASGRQLREQHQNYIARQSGFVVPVRLDHERPELGATGIYVRWGDPKRTFDPSKPTIVIIDGGPGASSHSSTDDSIYKNLQSNILRFDQRGIALSRFDTVEQALDQRLYSTEYTAKDVAAILRALNIKKATLWGSSYGTITATVFAHQYRDATNAVILEGTVFSGYDGVLSSTNSVVHWQNKILHGLPRGTQTKLNRAISKGLLDPSIPPVIFFDQNADRGFLGVERFYQSDLVETIGNARIRDFAELSRMFSTPTDGDPTKSRFDIADFESHVNRILMVKEFGLLEQHAAHSYRQQQGEIVKDRTASRNLNIRAKTRFPAIAPNAKFFSAADYSFHAPAFYLQGTSDMRTPVVGAVQHFKRAAQGPATIALFSGLGHSISSAITHIGRPEDRRLFADFLDQVAASGSPSVQLSNMEFLKVHSVDKKENGGSRDKACRLLFQSVN